MYCNIPITVYILYCTCTVYILKFYFSYGVENFLPLIARLIYILTYIHTDIEYRHSDYDDDCMCDTVEYILYVYCMYVYVFVYST